MRLQSIRAFDVFMQLLGLINILFLTIEQDDRSAIAILAHSEGSPTGIDLLTLDYKLSSLDTSNRSPRGGGHLREDDERYI